MARDATARLYDVDDLSVKLDKKAGTITFRAKKGKRVDLDKLHESIRATRLGDGTGMDLYRMYVTAKGEVSAKGNDVMLKLPGTDQRFVLGEESGKGETFQRLREALKRGEKVVQVTGRLDGWKGNFTKFLSRLPDKPRRILVTEFQTAKP